MRKLSNNKGYEAESNAVNMTFQKKTCSKGKNNGYPHKS